MKKLLILLAFIFTSTISLVYAQPSGLEKVCVPLYYAVSGTGENQECPLNICISMSVDKCEIPNECGLRNEVGHQICSKIEHLHSMPFSEICYYQILRGCEGSNCEIKIASVSISRGVAGETLILTGTAAETFGDIIFNNAPGFLNIGTFTLGCDGEEADPKTLFLSNLGSGTILHLE
jgi:hypothetical protein